MKIEKNTAVTLRFKVAEIGGKVIEESADPSVYLHGGYGNTLPRGPTTCSLRWTDITPWTTISDSDCIGTLTAFCGGSEETRCSFL